MLKHAKVYLLIAASIAAALIAAACGGGEEATPAATSTRATGTTPVASPTTAPQTTTTAVATLPPQSNTGTILDKAVLVSWYDLDGVRYGGTFRDANSLSLATIDPMRNNSSPINSTGRYYYEKLVGMEPVQNSQVGKLSPILAESWSVSTDLKTYTFTLRKGIKWHNIAPVNGRELVADDVAYSMRRSATPDSIRYSDYQIIDTVDTPDKYTVVVKLKSPNAWALNQLFTRPDYIVAKELVELEPDKILKTKAIGTGPFMMKSYEFRRGGSYVRNPDYWKKDIKGNTLPYLDAVEQTFVGDIATVVAGYRTNQFDSGLGTEIQSVIDVGKTMPGLRVYSPSLPTWTGIAFNTKKAPWNNVNVRRAMSMAWDKKAWFDNIAIGDYVWNGPILWELVSDKPGPTFDDLGPYYKYNPTESKRLRVEAGFTNGNIKIASPLQYRTPGYHVPRVLGLKEFWKKEGIELDLVTVDGPVFNSQYYQRVHEDLALTFHTFGDISLSTYAQSKFKSDATENTSFINDPEVEKVVSAIQTTTDPAKLREYARFLWDFDTLGMWTIWMPQDRSYTAFSPRTRNFMGRHNDGFTSAQGQIMMWVTDAPRTSP